MQAVTQVQNATVAKCGQLHHLAVATLKRVAMGRLHTLSWSPFGAVPFE